MRKTILATLMFCSSVALAGNQNGSPTQRASNPQASPQTQTSPQTQAKPSAKKVDLVIALDTSSSMDGLIDAARAKLWDVVSLLSHAKPQPTLRVGLISYGNDGYDARVGWVHKDSDLSTNLDEVYAKLFALKTNGGSEYVARAVHDATRDMKWDQDPGTLKIIFIAGNEPANQDPQIPVDKALSEAREKGILVNAIYCGADNAWEASGWRRVATLGSGQYAAIDQNRVVAVATPMDKELAGLSDELNQTYVGYGARAEHHKALQRSMDATAVEAGAPAAAARAVGKGSALYRNDEWDLVDARAHGKNLKAVKPEEMPAPMKSMSEPEREAFLDGKAKKRADLQKRIGELSQRRDAFIAAERKKQAAGPRTFDDAVSSSIKDEAKARGLAF
jgi:hypothetical protein